MMELFEVDLNLDDHPFSREELVDAVGRADVLVPTVTDRLDANVLNQSGEKLRLIASFSTGVDNVDLRAAEQRGITVYQYAGCSH